MKKVNFMMRRLFLSLGFTMIAFSSFQAHAEPGGGSGFYFEETFFPVYKGENNTNSSSPGSPSPAAVESTTGFDSRTTVGYVLGKGLLIGATYNFGNVKVKRDATSLDESLDETIKNSEFGPTVGWVGGNWKILLTYFTSGTRTDDEKNADNTGAVTGDKSMTYSGLSGFQAQLGYSWMLTPRFGLGPSLVYRTLSYSKQSKANHITPAEDYSDLSLDDKYTKSSLDAMVSLVFRF